MLLLKAKTVFGSEANSAVRLGLLGCGNRGTSVATSFSKSTTAQVVALADMFPDNLAAGKAHFDEVNAGLGRAAIDSKLLFHGPHAFEQLAASPDVDLIQISTPPFFHVQHLDAAVAAGKHVYCEKPVGVDVAQAKSGARNCEEGEVVRRASMWDSNAAALRRSRRLRRRIQGGASGKIAAISANYNAPASLEKMRGGGVGG